jgi:hypothetical protein
MWLHADLALADTWVTDTVVPSVEHGVGVGQPAQVDVLAELGALRVRAVELASSNDAPG